jgi:hypothetical protein
LITASAKPEAGEIIYILDILDEYEKSELASLIQKLYEFYEGHPCISDKSALKFLVTSRPLPYIADSFYNLTKRQPTIRLAGKEDIV